MSESEERVLRWLDVKQLVGLSRVTAWRMEKKGEFPARVRLGEHSTGWILSEVESWIKNRPRVGERR